MFTASQFKYCSFFGCVRVGQLKWISGGPKGK